jgi:hypothetical protein
MNDGTCRRLNEWVIVRNFYAGGLRKVLKETLVSFTIYWWCWIS